MNDFSQLSFDGKKAQVSLRMYRAWREPTLAGVQRCFYSKRSPTPKPN
jgi:hypothetical protein